MPPSLDDSLPPLSDSFLESGQLTSTGESTADPSIETRHSESSESSAPPVAGVNSDKQETSEVDFVPSEIARTSSEESLERSLQDMSVEDIETAHIDKGHDLCVIDESEEDDILDSAIKKIGVQSSPLTLDEALVIHPPPIKSIKLDGEPEVAKNKNDNKALDENSRSLFDNNRNNITTETGVGGDMPPSEATPTKHSRLAELLQDDNARIRCSSEGSSFKSYFDPVMRGEVGSKKRRWSLDKNNTASKVSHHCTVLPLEAYN